MPLSIIALVYALAGCCAGWGILLVAGRGLLPDGQIRHLMVGWFGLTFLLFLLPSGALFLLLAATLVLGLRAAGADPMVLWLFLIGAVPTGGLALYDLPFGINYLFTFTFAILLSLVIAIPMLFAADRRTPGRGAGVIDVLFGMGALMMMVLTVREVPNLTSWLRAVFVLTVSMVLPYLAASRRMPSVASIEQAVRALVSSHVPMAMIGLLAAVVGWAIYDYPEARLFQPRAIGYISRAGLMRSGGPLGGAPIVFGTLMMMGAAMALGLRGRFDKTWQFAAVLGACCVGLVASVSRGPMVGLALALVAYQISQPKPGRSLARLAVIAPVVLLPFVLFTSTGRTLYTLLPFIGSDSEGTVDYRQQLLENGLIVVGRNPVFGSATFLETPEMQTLIQGQGIIDLVNTYLHWTLQYGLITAAPISAALLLAGAKTFRLCRRLDPQDEAALRWRRLGGGLFAAQVGLVVTLATVSLDLLLSFMTWLFLGLQVAYLRTVNAWLAERAAAPALAPTTDMAPDPAPEPVLVPGLDEPTPRPAPRPAASFGPQTSLEELGLEGFKPIGGAG